MDEAGGTFHTTRPAHSGGQVKIQKLDHIALYMRDRDVSTEFLTSYLGFHIVDRTDRYTLVGAGGRIGKLTLFDAPPGTEPSPGVIARINVRVVDPESAAARLPREVGIEPRNDTCLFTGPESLPLALVPGEGNFTDYDLEGLILRSGDPEGSARAFVRMGFAPGEEATTVESAQDHRKEAEEQGLEIQDFVDGPNTLAVFVRGPEDVSVEYVEHKPTFSLT